MLLHEDLTKTIIKCFYRVYNTLGYGFLERVYENALVYELTKNNLKVKRQYPISVFYENTLVGEYFADILVEDSIILELKVSDPVSKEHEAQLLNYLKATNKKIGLLLYFGKKAKVHRMIF